jgi:hypothetical protein
MRKYLIKASLAAALLLPGVARADNPNLAGFSSNTQFFGLGGSTFDVQFLFGRQSLSSTLFYQTYGDATWTRILSTTGAYPAATSTPAPGTVFNNGGLGYSISGSGLQTVVFAICSGNVLTFAACGAPGPFSTTTPATTSTNVRTLSGTQWNAVAPVGESSTTTRSAVFGFEDQNLGVSDKDYNDVVFSTNLSTVAPEPSTVALLTAGLLGLAAVARRRKQNA